MSKLLIERAVVINEFVIFRKLINGMAKKFKLVVKIYCIYCRKINLRFIFLLKVKINERRSGK
jgi:hypothetical protein